jgi:hypothetical protein
LDVALWKEYFEFIGDLEEDKADVAKYCSLMSFLTNYRKKKYLKFKQRSEKKKAGNYLPVMGSPKSGCLR